MSTPEELKKKEEEEEKKRSKIMQLFVTYRGKLTAVMVKGKDPVYKIKEQLKVDPTRHRVILFFNGVELEADKPIYTYDIKDSSELVVEQEEIPQTVEYIPCENCGQNFPTDVFLQHNCKGKRTPASTPVPTSSRQTKDADEEALIPCENCGQFFPFTSYMTHASSCR